MTQSDRDISEPTRRMERILGAKFEPKGLDGEGVIQALRKCRDKFREYEESHRAKAGALLEPGHVQPSRLPEAEARNEKAERNREMAELCEAALSTISTPREDEVERVAAAIIVCNGDMVGGGVTQDEARRILASDDAGDAGMAFAARELAKAALATLTPREQRMEEALRGIRQLVGCDDGDKAESIVAICDAALSLQDKT